MREKAITLKEWHFDILRALNDDSFLVSSEIGASVWPNFSRRSASAAALAHLLQMEAAGLVERGDGLKPIIWRRTKAGLAVLPQETSHADA